MAFSMHSHSGQFCPGHAKDELEDIVQTAISKGMQTFGLTEHMPRDNDKDRYPEEESLAPLKPRHGNFVKEAVRLRMKYADKINILIGFEGEWIRPSYKHLILEMASNPNIDYFIGSIHHVHEIPIDYDTALYVKARDAAGGTDERLFEDYFDSQYGMLKALEPKVVGHLDLIRLLSDDPNRDLKEMKGVWERVVRNLRLIVEQGGLIELNTSALRKGLNEPYPTRSVCEEYLKLGGKLTLGDDSHGIAHVGTNFGRAWEYLESLGVKELFLLESDGIKVQDKKTVRIRSVTLADVKASFKG
ncbi:putative histidinol-phosphatase [Hyphodiscus hymeniophilus]|uniref:Histidinol-phosphatase n=1 Tax=Hyphodiscus hymeniophilus TaxID=353542 RepID=A0A9P6VRS4_9HELO|nr:putative histidinol-phosphatase [Hyphodiscus hymeniophilus]